MGPCYHLSGVECDNCRTGLSGLGTTRYYTLGAYPSSVSVPEPATKEDIARLEGELRALREEIRHILLLGLPDDA